MQLRPLLLQRFLQLLLLAVFFNAAIGMPLHEAGHLRQAMAGVEQEAALEARVDAGSLGHSEEAQGLCEWCLAYVHHATAPAQRLAALEVAFALALPRAPPALAFVPDPGRWPFASRDPPYAST